MDDQPEILSFDVWLREQRSREFTRMVLALVREQRATAAPPPPPVDPRAALATAAAEIETASLAFEEAMDAMALHYAGAITQQEARDRTRAARQQIRQAREAVARTGLYQAAAAAQAAR